MPHIHFKHLNHLLKAQHSFCAWYKQTEGTDRQYSYFLNGLTVLVGQGILVVEGS
jgi:hypothetical protein